MFLVIKSSFRKHPVNQSVLEGNEVVLTCTPPRGKPKPKLTWYKDDRPMSVDGQRISLQKGNRKLVIKNFKKDNEGTYFCEATNVAGRSLSHSAVVVRKGLDCLSFITRLTCNCSQFRCVNENLPKITCIFQD